MNKNQILRNITVEKFASQGKALSKIDGFVIFIENSVPGDIVDARVKKVKKNFAEAVALRIVHPSPLRVEPKCRHFGVCGGCKWQNLDYNSQLQFKQQEVVEAFEHIAGIQPEEVLPILPSPDIFYYRNKLEFTFSVHPWFQTMPQGNQQRQGQALGFHAPKSFFKVVDIEQCLLQPEPSNQIRNFVRTIAKDKGLEFYNIKQHKGFLRTLTLRNNSSGQFMVILQVAENSQEKIASVLEPLIKQFDAIVSAYYIVNQKKNDSYADLEPQLFYGQPYLIEQLNGLKFKIRPKSFFQTNVKQAVNLYNVAKKFADLDGTQVVYDLYSGTGTISLYVADKAKKVVGIEYIDQAVADAKENAQLNAITNAEFIAADINTVFTPEFISLHGKPQVLIIDPPRAGMSKKVIQTIKFIRPQKIVYISCNPSTQARDVQMLSDLYVLKKIQPVDMFPHTYHIENVALLEQKA